MRNLIYIIIVILVLSWVVGFIAYNSGGIIHGLLIIAVVLIFFDLFKRRRSS